MIRRPPRSTRTDTLFPYTTLFRSRIDHLLALVGQLRRRLVLPRLDLTDFAGAQVVQVDGAAVAILHAVDQRRHDALAAVHHHGIGGGHLHERGLAGAERHRRYRAQGGDDAKPPGVVGNHRDANDLRPAHRHQVTRLLLHDAHTG